MIVYQDDYRTVAINRTFHEVKLIVRGGLPVELSKVDAPRFMTKLGAIYAAGFTGPVHTKTAIIELIESYNWNATE